MSDDKLISVEKKLQAIINYKMKAIVKKAMLEHDDLIVSLNKDQLSKGINNKGDLIKPDYLPATVEIKKTKGQPTDKVYLLDTGAWQGDMKVEHHNDKLSVISNDFKEPLLHYKYGEEIEGLTDENISIVSNAMKETELKEIRKYLDK